MGERLPNEDVHSYDWYVLRTWTGREREIAERLTDAGFASYVVLRRYFRYRNGIARAKGKKELRVSPQLPGYVFAGFPTGLRVPWHHVFSSPYVLSVLGDFERPRKVTSDRIWRLMIRQKEGEFDAPDIQRFMESHREFDVGDEVTPLSGPFEGKPFKVESISGNVAELVAELFGGPVKVTSRVAHLAKW